MFCAPLTLRGSADITPSTSFQAHTSFACRAAPMMVAE